MIEQLFEEITMEMEDFASTGDPEGLYQLSWFLGCLAMAARERGLAVSERLKGPVSKAKGHETWANKAIEAALKHEVTEPPHVLVLRKHLEPLPLRGVMSSLADYACEHLQKK